MISCRDKAISVWKVVFNRAINRPPYNCKLLSGKIFNIENNTHYDVTTAIHCQTFINIKYFDANLR